MRILTAVAIFLFAVTGVAPVSGADLVSQQSVEFARFGQRAQPIVIYDYEPGVIVRAYWRAPWRNRHYFPATGNKPEIGREEDFSPVEPPVPAENFFRRWSTSALINRTLSGVEPDVQQYEQPPRVPLQK